MNIGENYIRYQRINKDEYEYEGNIKSVNICFYN